MPLFVPILRFSMLFLNVWDTYKTLKPPSTRIRNGKAEPPSVRSVTQRKRDLKGCLAVWIIWCCFSVYERYIEPLISLFIPFYNEFKALVILFLIFTRARGAEPMFLHVLRPLLRPYTKSIDSSLELFRLIGDLLFALISFPLRPLAALIPMFFLFRAHEDDIPPPYSESAGDRRTPSPFNAQLSNGRTSTSFYPADPAADMEWRRYPNLPSAYPPTPLVTSSRLPNPHPVPGHVGYDPSAAGPYTIWVPPVPEEDEDEDDDSTSNRRGFHRSLLPPRVPLHPGLGNHDGLSDESDRGAEHQTTFLTGIRKHGSANSSAEEAEDMEVDIEDENEEGNQQYESDADSDEDSFNITLQTPRVPLSLQPSSATASRSTVRLRASARSVFTEMERETDGKRYPSGFASGLPLLDTASNSGNSQGKSSPSSIDSESLSISSSDESPSMSMLQSMPHSGFSQPPALAGPLLIPLSGTENDDNTSDSSLGSTPGIDATLTSRFSPTNARGRKRSHSRSFPQKEKDTAGPSLQRLSSVESISSSLSNLQEENEDASAVASTSKNVLPATIVKPARSLRPAGRVIEEALSEVEQAEGEVRAQEVLLTGTRKRRKVISSSSASGQGGGGPSTTSESEPVPIPTRSHSRRKPLPVSSSSSENGKVGSRVTTRSSRTRKQNSGEATGSMASAPEEIEDELFTSTNKAASSMARGKRKVLPTATSKTSQVSESSVPTRKRFEVPNPATSKVSLRNRGVAKSSASSTLRMTRSMGGSSLTGGTGVETSDVDVDGLLDAVASGSGLEPDDYPLHVARERAKKRI